VRITGGTLRSRQIVAPKGSATRPTTDRVREALFGILDSRGRVRGAHVLDAFAGTGALGLEAMSRGAASVTFIESAKPALAALRKNIDTLGVTARVIAKPVERAASELDGNLFDLVFCDPPWSELGTLLPVITSLARFVTKNGWLVLEHDKRSIIPESLGILAIVERRVYGDTALAFFETSVYSRDSGELDET